MYVEHAFRSDAHDRCGGSRPRHPTMALAVELARLLLAHPGGLRRWSVMRAMRKTWETAHRDVSLKFEDEVERHFRYFSADDNGARSPERTQQALFFRPKEKAGEVWAANPDLVRAWLIQNSAITD